ncbi:MAG: twitching motility protein PilT [Acidimicrobiia bacterium]|nr:twitching motility protein PilT [Acidimicrobiia bacterium]
MTTLYDAGVLIAADGNDRTVWAQHRARLEIGLVPVTTAPVVAQASRSDRQVQLRRFLRGCDVIAFHGDHAHVVGDLLARSSSNDVVDAHVVVAASEGGAVVLTDDLDDIRALAALVVPPVVVRGLA